MRSWNGEQVVSGQLHDFKGNPAYSYYRDLTPSRHLTIVYNVFALMQIYGMVCFRNGKLFFNSIIFILANIVHYVVVQNGWLDLHVQGLTHI